MYVRLLNLEYVGYIIPVFLMFASTFKRTHWLVPGYCLGQIALRGGMHRGDTLGAYVLTCAASRRWELSWSAVLVGNGVP